ncbi:MAG: TldD/PmbA family protein [Erysipelotrichaceae bacterium]|nr:TldD/PmbA family protein [Erysipelotrichaceae bacterium]
MKAPFSEYLNQIEQPLKRVISLLGNDYEYVSALASDSKGLNIRISAHAKSVSDKTMANERGIVIRAAKEGRYCEYAFNDFDPEQSDEQYKKIKAALDEQYELLCFTGTKIYETPLLNDEACTLFHEAETEQLPETADIKGIVSSFTSLCEKAMGMSEYMIECTLSGQSTHVCKMFISANRMMKQSYVYSEATVVPVVSKDGLNQYAYEGISGLCGPELFDQLGTKLEKAVNEAVELLGAERIVPGEYEIITSPEVSGLIAHEAFGHGVEMDMFVKNRALGAEYINQRVASDLVSMHEGALCAQNVTSYAFDDEGNPAGDVTEIDHGILKTGICDALSAMRLGTKPTGNGKRENFEHKVYTRMTNTVFDSGTDKVEDMIASIKYGYLLEGMESGMEDPKHWGIQCIVKSGREIIDGKLTGKIVSPVILTGYVPEVLGNITMVSDDREIYGTGGCGKGYKEWVKVADGGPYLKTKARLG